MKHSDFNLGDEFRTRVGKWRVTDIGRRTIIAIDIEDDTKDPSWYNGPPYAVREWVFDENDFPGCRPVARYLMFEGRSSGKV